MKKVYLLILLSFFILLSACGPQTAGPSSNQNTQNTGNSANPPAPGGYLATGSNYVLFIQFTNTNGILSGEWDEADETTDNPPQVRTFNSTFIANLAGTQFNLSVNGRTYAGSFDGSNFTIEFPQTDGTLAPISLSAASIDDYNNAVRQLQQNVSQQDQQVADNQATAVAAQAAATATTDEQNRLNYDLANIGGATQQLASDSNFSSALNGYANDINQMKKDYQTEQHDANGGCSNANQVQADANQVQADANQITADDNGFLADTNQVSNDISGVQDFVSKIEQHWNNLGKSSPGITQNDIDTAVHNGSTAIQNAQAAVTSATSQVHGYDATSQQILQQANNLASSMKC